MGSIAEARAKPVAENRKRDEMRQLNTPDVSEEEREQQKAEGVADTLEENQQQEEEVVERRRDWRHEENSIRRRMEKLGELVIGEQQGGEEKTSITLRTRIIVMTQATMMTHNLKSGGSVISNVPTVSCR
jgi:hypothetical protein